MYDIIYLFKGMLVGLMVAVPLGPMGVLIIQKTLHKGALAGFIAGMGAASADFFYALVAAFGLGFVIPAVETSKIELLRNVSDMISSPQRLLFIVSSRSL